MEYTNDLCAARFAGERSLNPQLFGVRDDKAREAVQFFVHVYASSINKGLHF
jgi:hypothetical protein